MPETAEDLMAGITAATKKDELRARLERAVDRLRSHDKEQVKRLQEIERKVRAKHSPGDVPRLEQLIISDTQDGMKETVEFLEDFEDILPPTLQRLQAGLKLHLEEIEQT